MNFKLIIYYSLCNRSDCYQSLFLYDWICEGFYHQQSYVWTAERIQRVHTTALRSTEADYHCECQQKSACLSFTECRSSTDNWWSSENLISYNCSRSEIQCFYHCWTAEETNWQFIIQFTYSEFIKNKEEEEGEIKAHNQEEEEEQEKESICC